MGFRVQGWKYIFWAIGFRVWMYLVFRVWLPREFFKRFTMFFSKPTLREPRHPDPGNKISDFSGETFKPNLGLGIYPSPQPSFFYHFFTGLYLFTTFWIMKHPVYRFWWYTIWVVEYTDVLVIATNTASASLSSFR